ncbi:MAG: hypothetical protein ACYDDE_00380 [bacterium]
MFLSVVYCAVQIYLLESYSKEIALQYGQIGLIWFEITRQMGLFVVSGEYLFTGILLLLIKINIEKEERLGKAV